MESSRAETWDGDGTSGAGVKPRMDEAAFEALLAAHEAPLLRYATRILRDPESAQDVVQEVFLRYFKNPPEGRDGGRISVWLHRVAHNLCVDSIRKEIRMRTQMEHIPTPAPMPLPGREMIEGETRAELETLLGRLSDNQRSVVVLKIQEGKSYREISEITGLTVSNVGFLIHQAMKKLNGFLRESGEGARG